jgi:two-component sensor histidine kinase
MNGTFELAIRTRKTPIWVRYLVTTLLVLACAGLRVLLLGRDPGHSFFVFMPAVVIASTFLNRGNGIYAGLLGAAAGLVLFVHPAGALTPVDRLDLFAMVAFLAVALGTAFVLEALHTAVISLYEDRNRLAEAHRAAARAAEQRGLLLSEATHRARNDLQRLAATLHMQAGTSTDAAVRGALAEASSRVASLAQINARLDRHRDNGRAVVDSEGFLTGQVEDLREGLVRLRPIALTAVAEGHILPMWQAGPMAMVVNELIVNAVKYAFPSDLEGAVEVRFWREDDEFVLTVQDDGIGMDPAAPPSGTGLGTRICRALVGQMRGRVQAEPVAPATSRPGLRWTVRFPASGRAPD